ncbi:MAG: DsbA family protein [Alphaproteobacteria bacterium]|nr:DsbA family protein [Alphaproteobacteria bacterium]
MRKSIFTIFAFAITLLIAQPSVAADVFTAEQRTEIENMIRELVTNKEPEILKTAIQNLQRKEMAAAETRIKEKLTAEKKRIYDDANTPVGGNPKGKIVIVEFFDYTCGYCKRASDVLSQLIADDKDVKILYKNFPVLGPNAVEAAKASLASNRQKKFKEFHDALMKHSGALTNDSIMEIAKTVGLDVDKLKKDMADPKIQAMLDDSMKLGRELGVEGTPFFIVNDNVFPGALQLDQFKQIIAEARSKKK